MIRYRASYERIREADEHRRLRAMTMREGIRVAEALLTSDILASAPRSPRPRPRSLARFLGIRPERFTARGR